MKNHVIYALCHAKFWGYIKYFLVPRTLQHTCRISILVILRAFLWQGGLFAAYRQDLWWLHARRNLGDVVSLLVSVFLDRIDRIIWIIGFYTFSVFFDRIYWILQPQLNKKPERFHGVKIFIFLYLKFPEEILNEQSATPRREHCGWRGIGFIYWTPVRWFPPTGQAGFTGFYWIIFCFFCLSFPDE